MIRNHNDRVEPEHHIPEAPPDAQLRAEWVVNTAEAMKIVFCGSSGITPGDVGRAYAHQVRNGIGFQLGNPTQLLADLLAAVYGIEAKAKEVEEAERTAKEMIQAWYIEVPEWIYKWAMRPADLPVRKIYAKRFDHEAITLPPECLGTNESGWTVVGEIHEDYYEWINEFRATHPELGIVEGDFEKAVWASSEEALRHFLLHHPPTRWDYHDI